MNDVTNLITSNVIVSREISSKDCWIWLGPLNKSGYGKCLLGATHRVMYEACNGPIPDGMLVCHTCDNPPCCNPEHLWVGTNGDNHRDSLSKGRRSLHRNTEESTSMQDPLQAQRMTDLRMKILENERAGRPRHHEIDPEELKQMIDALRRHRSPLAARGGKASGVSKRAKKENHLDEKLKKFGLNFD